MTSYILHRECLAGIVLLMDIRHPLTELDRAMLDLAVAGGQGGPYRTEQGGQTEDRRPQEEDMNPYEA